MVDGRFRGLEVHGSRFRGRAEREGSLPADFRRFPQMGGEGRRGLGVQGSKVESGEGKR
jgi:hypothetical protein